MSAEQEREQLIEAAARLIDGSALDDGHPHSSDPLDAAERLVDADWRPPPSGDVVEQAARLTLEHDVRQGGFEPSWDNPAMQRWLDGPRELAHVLAVAGLLRTPGCYDPIECGHEAALGEAEAKLEQLRQRFEDLREEHRKAGESWDRQRDRLEKTLTELTGETPSGDVPVPAPPGELIHKVAEAIRNAYADEILKAGGAVPPGMDLTDLCGTVTEWHAEAQAAVRALREADHA